MSFFVIDIATITVSGFNMVGGSIITYLCPDVPTFVSLHTTLPFYLDHPGPQYIVVKSS